MLLAAAALLFSANAERLGLPALDDCFYARKAVEMSRSGAFFTVTWNQQPTFQNPPLQIWLVARAMGVFGETDLAVRLPSMVMALLLLCTVYRIGRQTVGEAASLCAVALLAVSPYFANNARRCMMEVPLALWVSLAILVFLEGNRRPRIHLALALPLAAAVLTKSVLGLLPLIVIAASAVALPSLRAPFRRPWIWLGVAAGLLGGASWTADQYAAFGPAFLDAHYGREVVGRASERPDLWSIVSSYPRALLTSYQPVVLPALAGAFMLWRGRRAAAPGEAGALLVVWAALPPVLYSLSSARSPRYLFPVFPALALCAGGFVASRWPRGARWLTSRIAPVLLLAGAFVFWVQPDLLGPSGTAVFKEGQQVRARVPAGEQITYLAHAYDWGLANPLLYYSERVLESPTNDVNDAIAKVLGRSSGLLMVERSRLPGLGAGAEAPVLLAGRSWALLDLQGLRRAHLGASSASGSAPGNPGPVDTPRDPR